MFGEVSNININKIKIDSQTKDLTLIHDHFENEIEKQRGLNFRRNDDNLDLLT